MEGEWNMKERGFSTNRVIGCGVSIIMAFCCGPVSGALIHRYSFNDGTARDSVDGAHGVLINNTGRVVFANGQLRLGNDGSQSSSDAARVGDYVDLPNGIISACGSQATFEFWVTWNGPSSSYWQKIMSFGTSDQGENGSSSAWHTTCIMLCPNAGNSTLCTGSERRIDRCDSEAA